MSQIRGLDLDSLQAAKTQAFVSFVDTIMPTAYGIALKAQAVGLADVLARVKAIDDQTPAEHEAMDAAIAEIGGRAARAATILVDQYITHRNSFLTAVLKPPVALVNG